VLGGGFEASDLVGMRYKREAKEIRVSFSVSSLRNLHALLMIQFFDFLVN
jgi:hypothetical protein